MAALPWSDGSGRVNAWLYVLVGLIALAELAILVRSLIPEVHPDYRAYFIDRTTTCLDKRRAGAYALGQTVSFRLDGARAAGPLRVCGWSGPAGDGTHSLGTSSRLRLGLGAVVGDLTLTVRMVAGRVTPQRVIVAANGARLGEMDVESLYTPKQASFIIPYAVHAGRQTLDIEFFYPDAYLPNPRTSEIFRRAVKLLSIRLQES